MGLPGVSAGSLGGVASSGGGGGVTPGGGSSGFTQYRAIVADAAGALNQGPSLNYDFIGDGGGFLSLRFNLEAGGPGSYVYLSPTVPLTAGAAGYEADFAGGDAADASGAVVGGVGGPAYVYGGTGGDGSATQVAGAGGPLFLGAGQPGASGGAGGANGADVFVDACDGTGAGVTGSILIGVQTTSLLGTRYVRVGPDAGSVPLLVDRSAPVGAELLNVRSDTDALSLLGRTAIGSWVATDEVNVGHYDFRATATGYALRTSASGTTLVNAPGPTGASLLVYTLLGGSIANGWVVGDGAGNATMRPLTTNAFDIGTTALKVRDIHLSRDAYVGDDVEFLANADHDIYVAAATGTGGGLNIFAANGVTNGTGGSVTITAGNSASSSPGTPRTGGGVTILAGTGSGDASVGGSVTIDARPGNSTNGQTLINTVHAAPVVICHASGSLGFYGVAPVALQTGVAVTAAAIHAALVNLGLITA